MEETTLHKDGSSAVRNIALEKEGKKSYCNRGYSYLVTHPSANLAEQDFNSVEPTNHVAVLLV